MHNLKLAFRGLWRHPRFALIAIATLAVGVGANVAIYSVVRAVLLRPLPYAEPDRLVFVSEVVPDTPDKPDIGYADVTELARRSRVIESVASYEDGVGDLIESGQPEVVRSLHVSRNFFDTLGVPLSLGRTFTDEEDQPGPNRAVILSHGFWQRRFGGDPRILGRALRFDQAQVVVVGVLPERFEPLIKGNSELLPDVYMPLGRPTNRAVRAIARLRPGMSVAQATTDLASAFDHLREEDPASHHPDARLAVVPLRERLLGKMDVAFRAVLVAVVLVLLIACANVTSLSLAKTLAREKEMSVRVALGATRRRLGAQLLIESLTLALIAGLAGTVLAAWGTTALARVIPPGVPRVSGIHVDGAVLLFALALTVATGVLSGLAPLLWALRGEFHDVLQGSRGTSVPVRRRMLSGVVIAQVAVALVLLVGATLVARSYARLLQVDPGYDPHHVLTLTTRLWSPRYWKDAPAQAYYHDVLDRVRDIPGVEGAAFASAIPMDYATTTGFHVAGAPVTNEASAAIAQWYSVTPDYFRVMRIRLLQGRAFTDDDQPDSPRVAIVNATFARQEFGSTDPIGQRLKFGDLDGSRPWLTIVGVVADVHQEGLDAGPAPQLYVAETQELMNRFYRLLARTDGDTAAIEQPVIAAFTAFDRNAPVSHVKALDAYLQGTIAGRTFAMAMLMLFSALALVLATAGVYALIAYSTALRSQEFGVRLTLGASPLELVGAVLRQAAVIGAGGVVIGLALALALARFVATLLFGLTAYDGWSYVTAALGVIATVIAAGAIPAWRASRLDPVSTLRTE
ncbi:MAG TPA: ABC transporter permease [Vicinamibacterales bacterium]|nr:ABC transporter permease [Vicinamibacterales bacterium]